MAHVVSNTPDWHIFRILKEEKKKLCSQFAFPAGSYVLRQTTFFVIANMSVSRKQRADKGSVIESTVVLISGASLSLIKHRPLVVMGDNGSPNRAVTLDQTGVLPEDGGSVGLRRLWRTLDGRCRRKRRREEEGRGVEEVQKIRNQQENQQGVSLALELIKDTKNRDRISTTFTEGQTCIRCVICYLSQVRLHLIYPFLPLLISINQILQTYDSMLFKAFNPQFCVFFMVFRGNCWIAAVWSFWFADLHVLQSLCVNIMLLWSSGQLLCVNKLLLLPGDAIVAE